MNCEIFSLHGTLLYVPGNFEPFKRDEKKKFQHAGLRLKIAMAETPEECSLLLRQEQNHGVDAHNLSEKGGKIGGYRPLLFLSICRVQRTLNSTCMCAYLMPHVLSMKTKT